MIQKLTWDDYNKMLSELMNHHDGMTDWEQKFMNNMAEYEDAGRLYSTAEKAKIEELHDRYCE